MSRLKAERLDICEEGRLAVDMQADNATKSCSKRSILQIMLAMVMFNLALIALIYLFFLYMDCVDELQRCKLKNAFYVIAGILGFYMLYKAGDASKDNPHFYYI